MPLAVVTLGAQADDYVLGTQPTLSAAFRVGGVLTDPTVVTLTVEKPDGTETTTTFPVAPVVTSGVGLYSALVNPNVTGRWAYRWVGTGAAAGAAEDSFRIISSFADDGLAFLTRADDFEGIRALLGVGPGDADDALIRMSIFAPQSERIVKWKVPDWSTWMPGELGEDLDKVEMLRLSASYGTACLMAASWAKGGTLGNVRMPEEPRDWQALADQLCLKAEEWIGRLLDTTPGAGDLYDLTLMHINGPTRAWHRILQVSGQPRWWTYPPIINAPPDWTDWFPEAWLA